jgi:hypothetical protein
MNGRAIAIGSGLIAAAVSAAIIGGATAAADGAKSERPRTPAAAKVDLPSVDPAVQHHHDSVVIARYVRAVQLQQFYDAVAANELRRKVAEQEARARAAAARRSASSSSSSGGGDVLACIKHRESRGQYGAVNTSSGAAGAYQFMPSTWDSTARRIGRTDLVGVNPANASPADQEAMARALLAWQGLAPWGGACG